MTKFFKKPLTTLIAIAAILVCSMQAYAQRTISGKVVDAAGVGIYGVSVVQKGTTNGTTTDANGAYKLLVSDNNAQLTFSYVGYETLSAQAGASSTVDVALAESSTMLNEVAIVGSRSTKRTLLETPVPVDILSMAEVANNAPQPDLNQILTFVAPSFNSNRQTISDGTDHIDPASLRGLGPDQVLVLLNGKRRHQTSLVNVNGTVGRGNVGTDLNSIPGAAIEQVEILRDGAAAQYGSDAIAGVINLRMKGITKNATVTTGTGINKAGDGLANNVAVNYGFKLGDKGGFINVTGDFNQRDFSNRADDWTGGIYGAAYLADTNLNVERAANDNALLVARGLTRKDFTMRVGNSAIKNVGFFINSVVPLSNGAEFYAFGGKSYRAGNSAGFYRLPSQTDRSVFGIYKNGFLPEINSNINDISLATGLRGKFGEWAFDLSNTFGKNSFQYQIGNTVNASLLNASPTSFNAGGYSFSQNITNMDLSRYYDNVFSGLNVAAGGEVRVDNYQVVAGEEGSYKNYGLKSVFDTDTAANGTIYLVEKTYDLLKKAGGSQVFPGFTPKNEVNRYRTVSAGYIDLEADITKRFMVAAAARIENYSDFGNALGTKLASRFTVVPEKVFVRGSYATGFRAPSLHQLYYNQVGTQFVGGTPFEVGTFSNESAAAKALGMPQLKAEKSKSLTVGATAKLGSLSLSLDAYQIGVTDRVVLTGQFSGSSTGTAQEKAVYAALNAVGAGRAQFFTNAINTSTRGLDLVATYDLELGKAGALRTSISGNFNKTTIDKINTNDKLAGLEATYFDRENQSVVETGTPINKYNLTLQYNVGKLSTTFRAVRFGEVSYKHPTLTDGGTDTTKFVVNTFSGKRESRDQLFSARIVSDLIVSYQITPAISITVGANNLFDVYPDKHKHSDNYSFGRFPYSRRVTQFGFNGAYFFGKLNFKIGAM